MLEQLDPDVLEKIQSYGIEFGIALIKVILIFVIGRILISYIMKGIKKAFKKSELDVSLASFLTSFLRFVFYIALVLVIAQSIDIKIAALLGVLGAAGLAIGLALQGSLSNFAGGILILITKPFKVDDIIEAQGHMGVVEKIDILHTHLRTFDNQLIIIPNGGLANSSVKNATAKDTRRAELNVGVAYGSDLQKVREIILGVLSKDDRINPDPEPVVKFTNFGDSSLDLSVRVWTSTDNLWPVYFDNMEAINNEFVKQNIEIPFPQRDIHMRTK
ncbi:mechanosensitive ion channel family protein [Marivirga arenosa]|uniref:Mechanosensitive ion channel n=1 Tax=Marivirga arenosa TaxID=3059076 RepID=A0AA51RCE6_9BACT|nr:MULTISPECIES: mechanosensitive ion channel domain-containing protein [unclassified Marivirga]WKK79666.2 mechanosensitive ion channel [Marivirga sp. BKB1-2]WMN06304.1 mechanosensitive ion channel [Marivirga sp. ABR2-2]